MRNRHYKKQGEHFHLGPSPPLNVTKPGQWPSMETHKRLLATVQIQLGPTPSLPNTENLHQAKPAQLGSFSRTGQTHL